MATAVNRQIPVTSFVGEIDTALELAQVHLENGEEVTISPGKNSSLLPRNVTNEREGWFLRFSQIVDLNTFHNRRSIGEMHRLARAYLQEGLTVTLTYHRKADGRQNWTVDTKIERLVTNNKRKENLGNIEIVTNKAGRLI